MTVDSFHSTDPGPGHHDLNTNIWIVGYGDIGRRVASLYQREGIQTSVTTRNKESLDKANVLFMDLDIDSPTEDIDQSGLEKARVFYFVPPPREGRQDSRITSFLQLVEDKPERIVLISTTGVYGDCKGEWVDESHPINPVADRAWRRADAEQQLTDWSTEYNKEAIILRVPGIYAEDRLPLARLEKGLPIVNQQESPWTNRIHADDLAMVCYQAMQKRTQTKSNQTQHEIYNVSDGNPSTMAEYFNQVADYAGLPRPPQIALKQAEKQLSTGMLSYMKESRRIYNKKMLENLNVILKYPLLSDCLGKQAKFITSIE